MVATSAGVEDDGVDGAVWFNLEVVRFCWLWCEANTAKCGSESEVRGQATPNGD